MVFRIKIEGDKKLRDGMRKLAEDLHGAEAVRMMERATLVVERSAKKNAPVDTGRLRNSITHAVQTTSAFAPRLQGIIGTSVMYAPFIETGTGVFVGESPYFPPPSALAGWARRHGMNPYLVARAIFEKGGLEPNRYLGRALEDNEQKIMEILGTGVSNMIRKNL
jgi:HK97 gp10 family phage protein